MSAVDAKESSNIIDSKTVLEVCVYFAGFVNGVTISTSVFLSVWSYLCLARGYLPFLQRAIVEDNKINYKNDSGKIKTAAKTIKTTVAR